MKKNITLKTVAAAIGRIIGYVFFVPVMALLSLVIAIVLFISAFGGRRAWISSITVMLSTIGEKALGGMKAELEAQRKEFQSSKK